MAGLVTPPVLSVHPRRYLVDERLDVEVKNLPPAHQCTLHSFIQSEDGDFWEAYGRYISDESGTVKGTLVNMEMFIV